MAYILLFFFFSSRRRHTRSKRDWSSDVCSSDLDHGLTCDAFATLAGVGERGERVARESVIAEDRGDDEIGRASCRERVWSWVGAGVVKGRKRRRGWWR